MSTPWEKFRALLPSLVPEERRGRPGAARELALAEASSTPAFQPETRAAWQVTAVYACLAAGEPREALRLLDEVASQEESIARRLYACRAWAQQLERNWYPGDLGAETSSNYLDGLIAAREAARGDAETILVEACAANGPGAMLALRSIVDTQMVRALPTAQSMALSALKGLDVFVALAQAANALTSILWARAAGADMVRRIGRLSYARSVLGDVRAAYEESGDSIGVATTWLIEGDWFATPGSSPDALGLRLEDEAIPQFLGERDDAAASLAYAHAQSTLVGVDAPRALGALSLRLALLAGRAGDSTLQASCIANARSAFSDAGDVAGEQLALVHEWIAALERGEVLAMRAVAPLEWGPLHGPVQAMAEWAVSRGSPAYCEGLGRLLQRCGQRWASQGEAEKAELAYRLARGLITLKGAVPAWTIPEALAHLDERRGFQTRSLVRRLLILDLLPPPVKPTQDGLKWMQEIYLTMGLISIPTGVTGAGMIAIQLIDRGADRLRALLELADESQIRATPSLGTLDELKGMEAEEFADFDAYKQRIASGEPSRLEQVMVATAAQMARSALARAQPLAALVQARLVERMGADSLSDVLFCAALEHSRSAGNDVRWIEVLVLNAWGKRNEAFEAFQNVMKDPSLGKDLLAQLALRAGDFSRARELFASLPLPVESAVGASWRNFSDRAEAEFEGGAAVAALELAQRGIGDFERMLSSLARESDRLDVTDDISAADLYQLASRARWKLARAAEACSNVQEAAEQRAMAFATADRHRALTLPVELSYAAAGDDNVALRRWQQATTEHATAFQRLLVALMSGSGADRALVDALAAAERDLAGIEAELAPNEQASLRQQISPSTMRVRDLQALLPAHTCLLEYQLVGRNLLGFAVTAENVQVFETRLPRGIEGAVNRLLGACEAGTDASVEEAGLAATLLEPFSSEIDKSKRLIVVPSGALNALPFHLLQWGGEPLCATRVVSYLPAAALLLRNGLDRPLAAGASLIIGDPQFDPELHTTLRRLAGAAIEARTIAKLRETEDIFEAERAVEADLRPMLPGRALLHFAAHGRLDDVAPFTSSLVLAGRDELTVSDFIGLRIDADLAVLSACDTGRGTTTLGGDLIGLTRGLLAAGVKRCIVSLWPVDDVAACVTMVSFHSLLKDGSLSPAEALAMAQREIRGLSGEEIGDRYRAMGGVLGTGERSRRRGPLGRTRQLPAYVEPDLDDSQIVDDLHGASARIWAPFILIG